MSATLDSAPQPSGRRTGDFVLVHDDHVPGLACWRCDTAATQGESFQLDGVAA